MYDEHIIQTKAAVAKMRGARKRLPCGDFLWTKRDETKEDDMRPVRIDGVRQSRVCEQISLHHCQATHKFPQSHVKVQDTILLEIFLL